MEPPHAHKPARKFSRRSAGRLSAFPIGRSSGPSINSVVYSADRYRSGWNPMKFDDKRENRLPRSFHSRRSMHSILLEGVDLVLKKHG